MTTKNLIKVALRYKAVFLDIDSEEVPIAAHGGNDSLITSMPVLAFIARLKENGFTISEALLHALNKVSADRLVEITECINDVMGVNLNWAPLVKQWDIPTGETLADHIITFIANIFGWGVGVVCTIIGVAWSLIVIAIAWLFYRPILGITLLVIAGFLTWVFAFKGKDKLKELAAKTKK